jgi:hypothetical protein
MSVSVRNEPRENAEAATATALGKVKLSAVAEDAIVDGEPNLQLSRHAAGEKLSSSVKEGANGFLSAPGDLSSAFVRHVDSESDSGSSDGDDGMMIVHGNDEDSSSSSPPEASSIGLAKHDGDQLPFVSGGRPPTFGSAVTLASPHDRIAGHATSVAPGGVRFVNMAPPFEEQVVSDDDSREREQRVKGGERKKLGKADEEEGPPGSPASKGSPSGSGTRAGGSPSPSHMRSMSVDNDYTF